MDSGIKPCTMTQRNVDMVGGMDRISSLPDELLGDILSFLPTKEAVATSVLSRRWKHVFTWITSLEFDHSPISHCLKSPHLLGSFATFKAFVDSVLQVCRSETITRFSLKCGKKQSIFEWHRCKSGCFPDLNYTHINKWICFAFTGHGVRELDLCVNVRKPGKLPGEIFACRTLEVLKLDLNLDLEVSLSFSLPNLKVFHLNVDALPDWESITRLVASCPCLVDLAVEACWDNLNLINLSAPLSLQRLVLVNSYSRNMQKRDVLLDIPNVRYLKLVDFMPLRYCFTNLNALVEAHIGITSNVSKPACEKMLNLVRMFSNVRHLSLLRCCIELLHEGESRHKLPVFHNLNHLQLGFNSLNRWHKVLVELLDCSPSLERLAFPEGISNPAFPAGIYSYDDLTARLETQYWRTAQAIPSCFRSHLKQIWIEKYQGVERELELVKYFLRSALILENLVIVCEENSMTK